MEIPENKNINEIREILNKEERIDVMGDNSGGFEAKVASEKQDFILEIVDKNKIRLDNPARIINGHPYILILPDE